MPLHNMKALIEAHNFHPDKLTAEQRAALHARPRPDSTALIARGRRLDRCRKWFKACPPILQRSDWSRPVLQPNRAAIDQVRNWRPGKDGRGLLISGPTGLGKSRAFWSLLHRLMVKEGVDVEIATAVDFFYELQAQIKFGSDCSARFIRQQVEVPILALDDLGQQAVTQARTEWSEASFFQIIDKRLGYRRPTIITTNLSAREMASHHHLRGDPLVRRLVDSCELVRFTLPKES